MNASPLLGQYIKALQKTKGFPAELMLNKTSMGPRNFEIEINNSHHSSSPLPSQQVLVNAP